MSTKPSWVGAITITGKTENYEKLTVLMIIWQIRVWREVWRDLRNKETMQVLVTEDVSNAGSCGGEEHGNEKPIAQNKGGKVGISNFMKRI